jgi:L-ribulose-5-phosphate 3-epimerase
MKKTPDNYSRRSFISKMAMAGAAVRLAGIEGSGIMDYSTKPHRTIHVFSKSLQWLDYDSLAEVLAEAGAEGIDLSVRPGGHVLPEKVESDLPAAVNAAHKGGLKVEMIVTAITGADEKYSEAIIKTASSLGIKFYRLGWLSYDEKTGIWGTLQKLKPDFQRLADLNHKYNIHGAYQNHQGTNIGSAVWDLYELLKDLDPEFIGCQYDLRHAVVEGGSCWPNGLRLIIPWIKCTDIKDFKWSRTDGKWNAESVSIGEGMVDFDEYFKIVQKYDVPGPISIHLEYPPFEHFDKVLPAAEKRKLFISAIKRDIDKVKSYLSKYQL